MSIDTVLLKLERRGNVYIYDSPKYLNDNWQVYQNNEKNHWHTQFIEKCWKPDPIISYKPYLSNWNIDASFFKEKQILEIGTGPYGGFSTALSMMSESFLPERLILSDSLMDFYQTFEASKIIPKKAKLLKAKGEVMPFSDNSFDIIIATNVIDHVQNCDNLLTEVKRILKPNGYLLFCVHVIREFVNYFKSIVEKVDKNHPYHFTKDDVLSLFKKHGFEIELFKILKLRKDQLFWSNENLYKNTLKHIAYNLMFEVFGVTTIQKN